MTEIHQAERKWRNNVYTIFKDVQAGKTQASKLVHIAKCQFETETIALSTSKELHQIVDAPSNRHLPDMLPTIFHSADLPSFFITHLNNKVEKLRANISLHPETSTFTLVTGTTAATSSLKMCHKKLSKNPFIIPLLSPLTLKQSLSNFYY